VATKTHINAHTGIAEVLTDIHPKLWQIKCYAVVAWNERRCDHPAKFLSERGVPVCGHHTKRDQTYTVVAPGEPATADRYLT
jgi:hypothetical protein